MRFCMLCLHSIGHFHIVSGHSFCFACLSFLSRFLSTEDYKDVGDQIFYIDLN